MATLTEADVQKWAEEQVHKSEHIPNFAYYGERLRHGQWAYCYGVHRDSDLLEESNFDAVHADMAKRFPSGVAVEEASHWAVGWYRHLAVRVLDKRGKATKAALAMREWLDRLEDYPVADESDYSEREWNAISDNAKDAMDHKLRDVAMEIDGVEFEWKDGVTGGEILDVCPNSDSDGDGWPHWSGDGEGEFVALVKAGLLVPVWDYGTAAEPHPLPAEVDALVNPKVEDPRQGKLPL